LIGEWERDQRCEEIVAALRGAGMEAWVLEYAAAFVPGASSGEDIENPDSPCDGSIPLRHSHFFTADGQFGSRDENGDQVDIGTYRIVDDETFVISNDFGSATLHHVSFRYQVEGETIMFEPVIPDCRPDCFEAVWSVTVAYEGLPWTRVAPNASPMPSGPPPASPTSTGLEVGDAEEWIVFGRQSTEPDGRSTGSQYLVQPDGTGEQRLVNEVIGSELRATWSPDGQRLAYIQATLDDRDRGLAGLWIIDADGSDAQHLFGCELPCNTIDYVDWGPDGNSIFFGMHSDVPDPDSPPSTFEIWRYDLPTGTAGPVLTRTGDDMTVEQPRVSPDGTQVVYMRQRFTDPAAPSAIFVADLEGGRERQLTDWDLYAAHPDWSFNDVIVFNSYDVRLYTPEDFPGARDLFTIAPDGTNLVRLTQNEPGGLLSGQPRWAPDGTGITYTEWVGDVSHLAYISADGTGQRPLTATGTEGGEPELRPVP
jgi:hypothetical protein